MRHESHTFIGHLRDAVEAWRKENGWSRETVVMHIVDTHERIDAPATTGIVFDPPTRDTFERAKVNADRVFRWLDDVTKDGNTVPTNFLPSILSALPHARRMALVNLWIQPLDLTAGPYGHNDDSVEPETLGVFTDLVKTSAAAQTAVADLLDGISPGEIERARISLGAAMSSIQKALHLAEHHLMPTPEHEARS